jgi:hypothetical protein
MNETLLTFIYFAIGWISTVIAIVFGLNFLTKGFVFKFLSVKGSRGKKQLIKFRTETDAYWTTGQSHKEKGYIIKSREGQELSLTGMCKEWFTPFMGIMVMDYDGVNGVVAVDDYAFVKSQGGKDVQGFRGHKLSCDPARTNQYIVRALRKPSFDQNIYIIILMILVIVCIIVAGMSAYYAYQDKQLLMLAIEKIGTAAVVVNA